MNDFTVKRIANFFSIYYKKFNYNIPGLAKREIAFSSFDGSSMMRHVSFGSFQELKDTLISNPPRHFFYSSAYYDNPTKENLSETWTGADLIFDIDADHIEGAEKMTKKEMLDNVLAEVNKLLTILEEDLGVKEGNMELVFSGSRGYHIHVYDLFTDLNSSQRREIVDYVTGRCLTKLKVVKKSKWEERLKNEREIIINKLLSEFKKKKVKELEFEGERFVKTKNFPSPGDSSKIERISIKHVIEKFGSAIDEPVTIDVHRLIRTPMSLHGKTGLMVKVLKRDELEVFDPLNDSVPEVFRGSDIRVKVLKAAHNDFANPPEKVEEGVHKVPLYLAIYLALSGNLEFQE